MKKARDWWRQELIKRHEQNTLKLANIDQFYINPFLWLYLANYFKGNHRAKTLAEVLVYPRVLGSSITTSFGSQLQKFITTVFGDVTGSQIQGLDIEFIDQIDGRRKYCQLKAGPNVINKDDVKTISDHFATAKRLAIANNLDVNLSDYILCLLYGEKHQKNANIKQIEKDYKVFIGTEFWYRLTGDTDFYKDLIESIGQVAKDCNLEQKINKVLDKLAEDIRRQYPDLVE